MLKELTTQLLSATNEHQLNAAAQALYALFADTVAVDEDTACPDNRLTSQLGAGVALSPRDAARCILDYRRTAGFLRGIHAALQAAQQRFPNETIQVLYAGCGPYAPLAVPLMTKFTHTQVQWTLLDIHQRSLDAARRIVEAHELSGSVRAYVRDDAVTYLHPPAAGPLHLVVIEAMQKALAKEPQVAITINLAPQLCAGGILIPQEISLCVSLADLSKEFTLSAPDDEAQAAPAVASSAPARVDLGEVFKLTEAAAHRWKKLADRCFDGAAFTFPPVTLELPQVDESHSVLIQTTVTTFEDITIKDYESGLTFPTVLHDLGRVQSGARLEFRYLLGARPGLKYRVL